MSFNVFQCLSMSFKPFDDLVTVLNALDILTPSGRLEPAAPTGPAGALLGRPATIILATSKEPTMRRGQKEETHVLPKFDRGSRLRRCAVHRHRRQQGMG